MVQHSFFRILASDADAQQTIYAVYLRCRSRSLLTTVTRHTSNESAPCCSLFLRPNLTMFGNDDALYTLTRKIDLVVNDRVIIVLH